MDDGLSINQYMDTHKPSSAVILGTGYIGMEMAAQEWIKNLA
jgi:pyruvate/2-oxoglutarate dehydrogenase complex dihydrolipoamide dehydrogenase (E3) component